MNEDQMEKVVDKIVRLFVENAAEAIVEAALEIERLHQELTIVYGELREARQQLESFK
jgi:uncharacterized coiled-coil DUF342 family protein